MVRYLFYTIGDLTYQSPLVHNYQRYKLFHISYNVKVCIYYQEKKIYTSMFCTVTMIVILK